MRTLGESIRIECTLLGLTAQMVAERAGSGDDSVQDSRELLLAQLPVGQDEPHSSLLGVAHVGPAIPQGKAHLLRNAAGGRIVLQQQSDDRQIRIRHPRRLDSCTRDLGGEATALSIRREAVTQVPVDPTAHIAAALTDDRRGVATSDDPRPEPVAAPRVDPSLKHGLAGPDVGVPQ